MNSIARGVGVYMDLNLHAQNALKHKIESKKYNFFIFKGGIGLTLREVALVI